MEVSLAAIPVVTPKAGEPAPKTLDDHLRETLRIHRMDPRPAFLYFHWPHETDPDSKAKPGPDGRRSSKLCDLLGDDAFTRWGSLVRCIEVDASMSDAKILERLGVGEGPSFAIVDERLEVVARSGAFGSAKGAAAFVKETLASKCGEYWKSVQARLEEQKKALAEARSFAKRKEWRESLARYDLIRRSDLRIADFFDDAVREAADVERKLR
jgi:hypothetical protein